MSMQSDPNGIDQHAPGAKLDAGKVRPSLILGPMARALLAVAEVGTYGANKYSDGGWQHVPNALKRYTDARDRHQLFESIEPDDSESGLKHAAHAAWNALARLELILRAEAASEQCGQKEAQKEAVRYWDDTFLNPPEWANFLAMDKNGNWAWFQNEPYQHSSNTWFNNRENQGEWVLAMNIVSHQDDWTKSLFRRPTSTAK